MHTPTCPVKMAGTLQRRCANCHCVLNRSYLRALVFHGQARYRLGGHDMPIRLPFDQLRVPVRQIGARITVSLLARYSSALVFLPLTPSEADWRVLRHGAVLRGLYAQKVRKAGDCFHVRVGAGGQTLLIVACLADEASTFERLQAAGKLARSALDGEPQSLLLWQQGCPEEAANASLSAAIAALEAAAFRFASFKTKPKARVRLVRGEID